MAKYNSVGTYEATSLIPQFKGLMQYGDTIDAAPMYATEAHNVETRGGVLQPSAECTLLTPSLPAPIETLARLYRRWYTGSGNRTLLVAASAGKLYAMEEGGSSWGEALAFPSGVTAYQSNVWSCVAYEINPVGSEASVDVLLLSNALDGMVMIRGDDRSVTAVETPKKFGVIERYAERIWGGAITEDPDMLVYSAPYDPTNWEANIDPPEDGAGDIMQPSWDGDSFTALRAFGSQLIAFKKNRVWRILGTNPGEYTFKEQFGGGAPYAGTIAIGAESIFMLSRNGVQLYDGLSVNDFQQGYCQQIWESMNKDALDQATAAIWQGRYYVAFPTGDSPVNNTVVIYDPVDATWLMRNDLRVEHFLATDDALYFTSATTPGRVWRWEEDSWASGAATTAGSLWVTPWNDLGSKSVVKGSFEVYLLCEVQTEPVTLYISLQTEKKTKTKQYTVEPVAETGRSAKQKRIHFGGSGRRFRLILQTDADTPVWRLVSGVLIVSETDPD